MHPKGPPPRLYSQGDSERGDRHPEHLEKHQQGRPRPHEPLALQPLHQGLRTAGAAGGQLGRLNTGVGHLGQAGGGRGEDLFQLGEELVGVQPLQVQTLLEQEISRFLVQLEQGSDVGLPSNGSEHLRVGNLHMHRLDQSGAARLLD